jgi:hypothetical protein
VNGLAVAAGDAVSVTTTTPSLDDISIVERRLGVTGSITNGGLTAFSDPDVSGAITIRASRPAGGGFAAAQVVTRASFSQGFLGVNADPTGIALRPTRGTTVTLSGGQLGTPMTYRYALAASLAGGQVVGTASPGALIRIDRTRALFFSFPPLFATAGANGSFSVPIPDPVGADALSITAVDVGSRNVTRQDFTVGSPAVQIRRVKDRQLVRRTVTVAADSPGASAVEWVLGTLHARDSTAPFAAAFDTRRLDDGVQRLDASVLRGGEAGAADFLFVIVDNTPPHAALPSEVLARRRRQARLHPGASDLNGIAKLTVSWGDGKRQTVTGSKARGALAHRYRRSGRFKVKVTVVDRAGNSRIVRTTVRVS